MQEQADVLSSLIQVPVVSVHDFIHLPLHPMCLWTLWCIFQYGMELLGMAHLQVRSSQISPKKGCGNRCHMSNCPTILGQTNQFQISTPDFLNFFCDLFLSSWLQKPLRILDQNWAPKRCSARARVSSWAKRWRFSSISNSTARRSATAAYGIDSSKLVWENVINVHKQHDVF